MTVDNILVKQWSFCKSCKGRGCSQCEGNKGDDPRTGVTSELIPLSSLVKHIRYEYATTQQDFIRHQKEKLAS